MPSYHLTTTANPLRTQPHSQSESVHNSGGMVVRSVRHRGLRWLIEEDNPWFLRQNLVDRVRKILTTLILAEHIDGFIADAPPGWRVHRLSGDRQDEWSVSVSGNWRITFEEEDSYRPGTTPRRCVHAQARSPSNATSPPERDAPLDHRKTMLAT